MSSPGGILNALATALHGSIRTAPSIHRLRLGLLGYLIPFAPLAFVSQCQCRPSRVLSPLVFFPISTHFTAPPEIPSAPTVLQLDALRPIIPDNACILCLTAAAGTELADAYSPDTVIASSLGKEVHDLSLGRVSVPVWLIILSNQLLIIARSSLGSIPEREPEKRLPHPRKAAGAQITHSRHGELHLCAALSVHRIRGDTDTSAEHIVGEPAVIRRFNIKILSRCSSNSEVMINRDNWGHSYCDVRGEILGSSQDEHQRKHLPKRSADVTTMARRAASGKPKILDSGGSMVAKLKLKGIDGRAPPGVEPAA
ncbi:actin beta/gamma 1 [Vigna unguiculata]|uniref:Actin beta/gamma 1 n=1 Tax=Vigna unguiculata TaxID=3917 RepID=A0A4D6NNL4_VIGUN|nr:actin beta/gamma 1 [Vigna unguiculata]